jgi:hypothetical protein
METKGLVSFLEMLAVATYFKVTECSLHPLSVKPISPLLVGLFH